MATTYKVLGQSAPAAQTHVPLYTVPASKAAVCSTLSVCNRGANSGWFRVAVRPAGVPLSNEHFVVHDGLTPGKDTVFLTLGITLAATDVVDIWANTAELSFNLFGSEVDA